MKIFAAQCDNKLSKKDLKEFESFEESNVGHGEVMLNMMVEYQFLCSRKRIKLLSEWNTLKPVLSMQIF